MYTRLLDSLICWYGRSMVLGVYRYLLAATALALGMLLNAVSLLAMASALGPVNLTEVPGVSAVPVYLGVILWLGNSTLAYWRFQREAADAQKVHHFDTRVSVYDRQIRVRAAASEPARRLMEIEAIGPQTATALVASMGDPHVFSNGRCYVASIGITPRQHSSGGNNRLGRITRQGDGYLRTLLVHGARAALRVIDTKTDATSAWARRLRERRHVNVAAVALAAKHAHIAWAILAHGTEYRPVGPEVVAA
jgi:transposase